MSDMHETNVRDCFIIDRDVHEDPRGLFQELYRRDDDFFSVGQANYSVSVKAALRGIHVSPYPKLVSCVAGQVFDVCVDLRTDSPTYLQSVSVTLVGGSGIQILIPANCGHAFFSVLNNSVVVYQQGGIWRPSKERVYNAFSPDLAIDWPAPGLDNYVRSEKDAKAPVYKAWRRSGS